MAEYRQAFDSTISSYKDMQASQAKVYDELNTQGRSTVALIDKLEQLTSTTESATQNKEAILAIIQALNNEMPDLALSYETLTNASGGYIDSLRSMSEAQAAQLLLQEQHSDYVNKLARQKELDAQMQAAKENARYAQEQYDLANKAYNDAVNLHSYDDPSMSMYYGTKEEAAVLKEATKHLNELTSDMEVATAAYEENAAELAKLEDAFKAYEQAQKEAAASGANILEVIQNVKAEMEELAAAYEEAYNAALDSVQGQYALWDKAASVVATSASSINSALESQITYWQDYNANLASLTERSADIEGLSELIASFADGSKESVNAVAGIAEALNKGDNDAVTKMVANWQELQKEQELVSGSLADLETDFTATMNALQQELETAVAEMNCAEEAAKSGRNTIEGFISAATSPDLLNRVFSAYTGVSQAALDALSLHVQYNASVSGNATAIDGSHAAGLDYVPYDGYIAELHKGERVLTSEEAQLVTFAPEFVSALIEHNAKNNAALEATYVETGRGSGDSININLGGVTLNIDAELAANSDSLHEVLYQAGDELGEIITEKIEDYFYEKARHEYR